MQISESEKIFFEIEPKSKFHRFLETFLAPSFAVEKGIEKTHDAVEGTIGKALTELLLW